jgi:hypothetical protein
VGDAEKFTLIALTMEVAISYQIKRVGLLINKFPRKMSREGTKEAPEPKMKKRSAKVVEWQTPFFRLLAN